MWNDGWLQTYKLNSEDGIGLGMGHNRLIVDRDVFMRARRRYCLVQGVCEGDIKLRLWPLCV